MSESATYQVSFFNFTEILIANIIFMTKEFLLALSFCYIIFGSVGDDSSVELENSVNWQSLKLYFLFFLALCVQFPYRIKKLKVQSCKLYNKKYMTTSTQITDTEILAFTVVLVFKLLSRKVLFTNGKNNRNC